MNNDPCVVPIYHSKLPFGVALVPGGEIVAQFKYQASAKQFITAILTLRKQECFVAK